MAEYRIPVLEDFSWQPPILAIQSAPPVTPTIGMRYIVGALGSGDWTGQDDNIAWRDATQWHFDTPTEGWATYNIGTAAFIYWDGTAWVAMGATGAYIESIISSTNNNIPQWDGITGDKLKDGLGLQTTVRATGVATDTDLATEKAVRDAVDAVIGAADALVFKGVIDCSGNPNYPAADAGWTYKVSVAGKIGGASGPNVEVGDLLICIVDSSPSGDHATVGANWVIVQANVDGAVTYTGAAVTNEHLVAFDGTTGRVIKTSGIAMADVSGHLANAEIHRAMNYVAALGAIVYEEV